MIQESINQIIGLTYGMLGIGKHLGGQETQTEAVKNQTEAVKNQTEAVKQYMSSNDVKKSAQEGGTIDPNNYAPTDEEVRDTVGATPPSMDGVVTPEVWKNVPSLNAAVRATYGRVMAHTGRELYDKYNNDFKAQQFRKDILLHGNSHRIHKGGK